MIDNYRNAQSEVLAATHSIRRRSIVLAAVVRLIGRLQASSRSIACLVVGGYGRQQSQTATQTSALNAKISNVSMNHQLRLG